MKNLTIKSIIFTLLFFQFSVSKSNAQTEKETIDFLNTMFVTYCTPMPDNPFTHQAAPMKYIVSTKIDPDSNSKVIVFDCYVSNRMLSTYLFHPKSINSITITPNEYNSTIFVLRILNKDGTVKYIPFDHKEDYSYKDFIQIPMTTSLEKTNRVKKGIIHLLELNGVEFGNENLFKD